MQACYTLLYVAPFYVVRSLRAHAGQSRDSDSLIKARIRAITFSCLACGVISTTIITQVEHASPLHALHMFGLWPVNTIGVAKTILLVSILFIGPLFEGAFAEKRLGEWLNGSAFRETFSSWIGWRNFIAGPVSEEILFRSFMIPLHILAGISPTRIVFLTPLYFGIAHIHHFYEFRAMHPRVPWLPALLRSLFQFTYTSIFGFFASFVFLRTGSVYAAIAAHMFCNWMGMPRLSGRVQVEAGEPISPPNDSNKRNDEDSNKKQKVQQSHIGWSIAYYSLLFIGAYGFYKTLWPLTESGEQEALVVFT
jgi:prenyl protein peptidase